MYDWQDDLWGALDCADINGVPVEEIRASVQAWMDDYKENTKALPEVPTDPLWTYQCVCDLCKQKDLENEALR